VCLQPETKIFVSSTVSIPKNRTRRTRPRAVSLAIVLAAFALTLTLAGCGAAGAASNSSTAALSITPGVSSLDTNCTGCNATGDHGAPVHRFAALLANGNAASVSWSLSGGDPKAGPGAIDTQGRYTPPSYLTADRVEVTVTARLTSYPAIAASAHVTLTAGFLQPLTPQNAAIGPDSSITLTGRLAQAGGTAAIQFSLSSATGALSPTTCDHSDKSFTTCTVTFTAPQPLLTTSVVSVVANTIASSRTEAAILLNTAGVTSNPVGHQGQFATLMPLGSSGGNNSDFDAHGNTIADCCSGTLGALLEDNTGRQYILSNNHVLAKSDHAFVGDTVVQPGLIDNNCTPNGDGPGTVPVAALTAWLPLKSPATNVDAAIAQVGSRTVSNSGDILELGARQPDGTLAAAPPGISSTAGRGEAPSLDLRVAKSGRTTGLTCGGVSAIDLDVSVDYFSDCAETRPYLTKLYTHQLGLSGDRLSDAGDSGALVVDASNAEPVGLFFAGGTDAAGVGQGVANPATEVLSELSTAAGNGSTYTFTGGADHGVSCLSYGNNTTASAQAQPLTDAEIARGQQSLFAARELVNPANGILGVAMGKSTDHPGDAAIIVYIDENSRESIPAVIEGLRTVVIPATADQVALGTAPLTPDNLAPLPVSTVTRTLRVKQQIARRLMRDPAYFGIGVGQSFDNPRDAALVLYVDRNRLPAHLPETIDGVRTRYIIMDRLHVTRSYAAGPVSSRVSAQHCTGHDLANPDSLLNPRRLF
jgi:hypothetical protein